SLRAEIELKNNWDVEENGDYLLIIRYRSNSEIRLRTLVGLMVEDSASYILDRNDTQEFKTVALKLTVQDYNTALLRLYVYKSSGTEVGDWFELNYVAIQRGDKMSDPHSADRDIEVAVQEWVVAQGF